jgi:hypothetical protein
MMPPERTARPPSGTRRHVTTTPFSAATNRCFSYNARDIFVAISPIVPLRYVQPHDLQDIVAIHNASIPPTNGNCRRDSRCVGERENGYAGLRTAQHVRRVVGGARRDAALGRAATAINLAFLAGLTRRPGMLVMLRRDEKPRERKVASGFDS